MDRKEAIEVVRKKVDYYEADKRLKAALEALIPELAASEDEKNWKAVLGYVKDDALRVWLEKQKEKSEKPIIPEWSDDDEKQLNWFYRLLDFIGKEFPSTWGQNHKGGKEWLKALRPQPNNNLRWRRAKAGENLPESIIIPDGEEPRFGKCAVKNSYYIPVEELKNLPKDGND